MIQSSGFEANGIIIPEGSFLVCPVCAESADLREGQDLRCPVCKVSYRVTTPMTYDEENKPYRLTLTPLEGHVMSITKVKG